MENSKKVNGPIYFLGWVEKAKLIFFVFLAFETTTSESDLQWVNEFEQKLDTYVSTNFGRVGIPY